MGKPKRGGICLHPCGNPNEATPPTPAICRFQSFLRRFWRAAVPARRGGGSGATVSPFRRNGVAVPAQRGGRSGATGWPFRRNGDTVPAQRHPRSGETG